MLIIIIGLHNTKVFKSIRDLNYLYTLDPNIWHTDIETNKFNCIWTPFENHTNNRTCSDYWINFVLWGSECRICLVFRTWTFVQDLANNTTPLCYSSKTCRFGNYWCMNLWKSRPRYWTPVRVEYLYFRRIWRIPVELSRTGTKVFMFSAE